MTEIMTHIRQLNDDYFDGKLSPAVVDLLANMPQKNKEAWSKAGYNAWRNCVGHIAVTPIEEESVSSLYFSDINDKKKLLKSDDFCQRVTSSYRLELSGKITYHMLTVNNHFFLRHIFPGLTSCVTQCRSLGCVAIPLSQGTRGDQE